jgi:hypothetical protein
MPDIMTVLSIDPSSALSLAVTIVLWLICAVAVLEAVGFVVCTLLLVRRERSGNRA